MYDHISAKFKNEQFVDGSFSGPTREYYSETSVSTWEVIITAQQLSQQIQDYIRLVGGQLPTQRVVTKKQEIGTYSSMNGKSLENEVLLQAQLPIRGATGNSKTLILQKELNTFLDGKKPLAEDGMYGGATKQAVKEVQKQFGLTQNKGKFDLATMAALERGLAGQSWYIPEAEKSWFAKRLDAEIAFQKEKHSSWESGLGYWTLGLTDPFFASYNNSMTSEAYWMAQTEVVLNTATLGIGTLFKSGTKLAADAAIQTVGKVTVSNGTLKMDLQLFSKGTGEVAAKLSTSQQASLNKLDNIIKNNLKESDFSGNPATKPDGSFFDHIQEMKQSSDALYKIQKGLEGSLRNPNLDSATRSVLQDGLDKTNHYLGRINDIFIGGGN